MFSTLASATLRVIAHLLCRQQAITVTPVLSHAVEAGASIHGRTFIAALEFRVWAKPKLQPGGSGWGDRASIHCGRARVRRDLCDLSHRAGGDLPVGGHLEFRFGAIAFTVARFYYFLNTQHSWPIVYAALLSILGLGPALGLVLYFGLFRYMRLSSTLVKVLATIGISVALPAIDTVIFGNQEILSAPGLAPQPVRVFHVIGVPVTFDQIIVYACVIAILLAGFLILRYTDVGLQIRALVDSPAMTSLSGTNPGQDVGGGLGRQHHAGRAFRSARGADHRSRRRRYHAW